MRRFTHIVGHIGFSSAVVLASCGLFEPADIGPGDNIRDATQSSNSGNGIGGAEGIGLGGNGMGGAGGLVNPCAGCIGTGGAGGASGAGGCVPFQTLCTTETNGICNDKEQCVDHCGDGVKDGDETDIDCGGGTCKKCLQGQGCGAAMDCDSQPNNELFCADGVCCNFACNGICAACNLPGKLGECTAMPDGMVDPEMCKDPMKPACLFNGSMMICSSKTANGELCMLGGDCASDQCVDDGTGMGTKVCKQANGTPCADSSVCASGKCISNVCLP